MKSGLDPEVFHPSPTTPDIESPLLVFVGRLAIEKNIPFLLHALTHPSLSTAHLLIVGDGPERARLENLSGELVGVDNVYSHPANSSIGVEQVVEIAKGKRVVFSGMVYNETDIARYYGVGDVFVSASASETFGFTVAEGMRLYLLFSALACGSPSVCVRSGAFREVYKVIDDWMYEEDNTDDFCGKVRGCLELGQGARRRAREIAVREFTIDAAVGDLLGAYREISTK
jgi:1,2-diacylglycerol 3-alpha-glucosyltransferase